ncbi:MAG: RNA polymerase sigma factor [Bacteroidota bacterium]|nr:RNA polymerase sigma factor [Bacteroidota bacterium]
MDKKNKNITDEEIVQNIVINNHTSDFGILYDRYAQKVYNKTISLVKDRDNAQDCLHDIFLKAYINLKSFKGKSKFSSWLFSLTYNFCIDYLRKTNVISTEVVVDEIIDTDDIDAGKEENKLFEIKSEMLSIILEQITIENKVILLMKYQDDMKISEIGESLKIGDSAVKMRLKRARDSVFEIYKKNFVKKLYK